MITELSLYLNKGSLSKMKWFSDSKVNAKKFSSVILSDYANTRRHRFNSRVLKNVTNFMDDRYPEYSEDTFEIDCNAKDQHFYISLPNEEEDALYALKEAFEEVGFNCGVDIHYLRSKEDTHKILVIRD
jgi:hypothetical protein